MLNFNSRVQLFSQNTKKTSFTGKKTKADFFIVNDIHGQNMQGVKKCSDSFDHYIKENKGTIPFKVSAGDIKIGTPITPVNQTKIWTDFLNIIGMEVSAIGNHELEVGDKRFASDVKDSKFKYLAANLDFKKGTELYKCTESGIIAKSCVLEKGGQKFGFIGVSPIDLHKTISKDAGMEEIVSVKKLPDTIKSINKEVEKLKKETGKIILLSHLGFKRQLDGDDLKLIENYKKSGHKVDIDYSLDKTKAVISPDKIVAENTKGVDLIIGGHSHDLIEGIVEGKNLLKNIDNEPVLITQYGRDGRNTGFLKTEWDDDTLNIAKCKNKINRTNYNYFCPDVYKLKVNAFNKRPNIAKISKTLSTPWNPRLEESKLASLVADGMRYVSGADVAFINGGNVRGALCKTEHNGGRLNSQDLNEIAPFPQHFYKVQLSEKEVVDTLKIAAGSFKSSNPKPGVMQVSGLKYNLSKNGELKEVLLEKDKDKYQKLNIQNPSDTKKISVVYDDFLIGGGDGFTTLIKDVNKLKEKAVNNPNAPEGYFAMSKASALNEYLRHNYSIKSGKVYSPDKDNRIVVS